jgi:hypothetical protein
MLTTVIVEVTVGTEGERDRPATQNTMAEHYRKLKVPVPVCTRILFAIRENKVIRP